MSRIQVTIESHTYYASKNADGNIVVGESNDGGRTYSNDTIYTVNSSGSAVGNVASSSNSSSSSEVKKEAAAEREDLKEIFTKELKETLENNGVGVINK